MPTPSPVVSAGRPLFRPEAVEAQRHQWLGRPQQVQPTSLTLLTAMAVLMAVTTLCVLWVAPYTRRVPVVLVSLTETQADLVVPESLSSRMHAGQAVRLRWSDPSSATSFSLPGRVERSQPAPASAAPAEATLEGSPGLAVTAGRPSVRASIRLDTADHVAAARNLPSAFAGAPRRAELLLEPRRVIDALLDPLRRAAGGGAGAG